MKCSEQVPLTGVLREFGAFDASVTDANVTNVSATNSRFLLDYQEIRSRERERERRNETKVIKPNPNPEVQTLKCKPGNTIL